MKWLSWGKGIQFRRSFGKSVGLLCCLLFPVVSLAGLGPTDIRIFDNLIPENRPAGFAVGGLSTSDNTGATIFKYSLVKGDGDNDNSSFKINGNALEAATTFDYETKPHYSVRIRSTNLAFMWREEVFTIDIIDENDKPTHLWMDTNRIAENMPAGTLVGKFHAIDPDAGDSLTFSMVYQDLWPDHAAFTIVGDELRTTASFNYEGKFLYSFFVRATDARGLSYEKTMSVSVTNVNDRPTAISLSPRKVAENKPTGTAVGMLSATDPEPWQSQTFSLVSGIGSTDNASFSISNATLITSLPLNYEGKNPLEIRLRVTDPGGLKYENFFVITVTNLNERPTGLSLSNTTVPENQPAGTVVGTLNATDPEQLQAHIYGLVSGPGSTDNASFYVSNTTLRTRGPFNYEWKPKREIRLVVVDDGGLRFEKAFLISIGDLNDAPTIISLSSNSVPENQPAGTLVGEFSAVDPDSGDTCTFSLYPGNGHNYNSRFTMTGNRLYTAESFDYEMQNSFRILVRARDPGGLDKLQTFTINVNDEPDPVTNLRVNCGGVAVSNWVADFGFSGGVAVTGAVPVADASRAPESVYRTFRKGSPNVSYDFPLVPDGRYKVRLHLAELMFNAAGRREFNVRLEGIQVLTNLDVFVSASGKNRAFTKVFPVNVQGGNGLQIEGEAVTGVVIFNGIEMWPVATSGAPGGDVAGAVLTPDRIRVSGMSGGIASSQAMAAGDPDASGPVTPDDGGCWIEYAYDDTVSVSDVVVFPEGDTAEGIRFLGRADGGEWFDLEGELNWFGSADVDAIRVQVPSDANGDPIGIRDIQVEGIPVP